MEHRKIKNGIISVGASDPDRRLFDELIPLPEGTTYNSYLVKGSEKTALIDTVDPHLEHILFENLSRSGVSNIDYVVANHAEQDHSGTLPKILEKYPQAVVLCSEKCSGFLQNLLRIPSKKIKTVRDGEEVSLGDRTLQFLSTPWVHWPETMVTWLKEDRILFSCDYFGAHLARSGLYVKDRGLAYEAAKRYFAEIMMPFRNPIRKNMEKVRALDIDIIAPSHGQLYDDPSFILDAYDDWVSDRVQNMVLLPFVSMHGSTLRMVEKLQYLLEERGIDVLRFDLPRTDLGTLAIELVDAATLVLGTPAFLTGPHPVAAYGASLVNALRPKLKNVSLIGSYSWGHKVDKGIASILSGLKANMLEPVMSNGLPSSETDKDLERLADEIFEEHKKEGIISK
ncbi:MAG: FprA family A-type flavoprotein [Fibrobacterota bacterium]